MQSLFVLQAISLFTFLHVYTYNKGLITQVLGYWVWSVELDIQTGRLNGTIKLL